MSRCSIDTLVHQQDPDAVIINCNRNEEAGCLYYIAALHSTLELQYMTCSILSPIFYQQHVHFERLTLLIKVRMWRWLYLQSEVFLLNPNISDVSALQNCYINEVHADKPWGGNWTHCHCIWFNLPMRLCFVHTCSANTLSNWICSPCCFIMEINKKELTVWAPCVFWSTPQCEHHFKPFWYLNKCIYTSSVITNLS